MRFFKLWVGIAMVAALVLGITLGNFVVAGGLMPGSPQDPLVSESYIVQTVEEKTAALEFQILELEKQVASLTSTVAALEAQMGKASSGSSSANSAPANQSSQSRQTNQVSQTAPANQTGSTSSATTSPSQNSSASGTSAGSSIAKKEMEVAAASGVNVRSGPSTSFAIIASLTNGSKVTVVSEASGWYEIIVEGDKTGWVHGDFLK